MHNNNCPLPYSCTPNPHLLKESCNFQGVLLKYLNEMPPREVALQLEVNSSVHTYCHVISEKKKNSCSIVTLLPPPPSYDYSFTPPSSTAQKIVQANLKPAYTLTDEGKLPYSLKLVCFFPDIDRHKISLESEKFNLLELHSS